MTEKNPPTTRMIAVAILVVLASVALRRVYQQERERAKKALITAIIAWVETQQPATGAEEELAATT